MKSYLITLILILCIPNHSKKPEKLVKDYLVELNNYNFEGASLFLDTNYHEVFIDGSVEIEDLEQLKDFMAWRKVMNSKSSLLSVKSSGDAVTTVEKMHHYMDEVLERKPRTFQIKYLVKGDKILKSIIDTLPGHSKIASFNYTKLVEFQEFCTTEGMELDRGMTADGALKLKKALELYKNRR